MNNDDDNGDEDLLLWKQYEAVRYIQQKGIQLYFHSELLSEFLMIASLRHNARTILTFLESRFWLC